MEVETRLPLLSHHFDHIQGRFAPEKTFSLFHLHPSTFLPGHPLVEPNPKDDGAEHQDNCLRGHLGILASTLPATLHHLLEVGHDALHLAGGLMGEVSIIPFNPRSSPSSPLCSWCPWVLLKISSSP